MKHHALNIDTVKGRINNMILNVGGNVVPVNLAKGQIKYRLSTVIQPYKYIHHIICCS